MSMLRRQEGQAAVLAVVMLTALLGMSALVLDVGAWFRAQRATQATADAAALAGAQALPEEPGVAQALALEYAADNGGGLAAGDVAVAGDTISAHAKAEAPGFFAKLFGVDSVNVGAVARARSANPAEGRWVVPMVVNEQHPLLKCKPKPCFGVATTLDYDQMGAPGAFGMLNLEGGSGTVGTSEEALWISRGFDKYLPLGIYRSDPGAKFSSSQIQSALTSRIGTDMLFPVFRTLTGSGQNAEYDIVSWVGFRLSDFSVHGHTAVLRGTFTRIIVQGIQSTSSSGQPDFGARTISLIE